MHINGNLITYLNKTTEQTICKCFENRIKK